MPEKIHAVLGSGEEGGFLIDDDFLDDVEQRVGMGSGAWDTIEPKEICAAVIAVFMERYQVREQ